MCDATLPPLQTTWRITETSFKTFMGLISDYLKVSPNVRDLFILRVTHQHVDGTLLFLAGPQGLFRFAGNPHPANTNGLDNHLVVTLVNGTFEVVSSAFLPFTAPSAMHIREGPVGPILSLHADALEKAHTNDRLQAETLVVVERNRLLLLHNKRLKAENARLNTTATHLQRANSALAATAATANSALAATQASTIKRTYRCSKCGLPKKGHVCLAPYPTLE